MWLLGKRERWFPISNEGDLYLQLDAIEESIFVEQKEEVQRRSSLGEGGLEIERMTFKKPAKF